MHMFQKFVFCAWYCFQFHPLGFQFTNDKLNSSADLFFNEPDSLIRWLIKKIRLIGKTK